MELSSFHSTEPISLTAVIEALRPVCGPEWLHRRDVLEVSLSGPWRPCDRWRRGPERLIWSVNLQPAGGLQLNDAGRARLWSGALARRHAPLDPAEILGAQRGSGLVVEVSDNTGLGYYALYRAGGLAQSRMLRDREVLVHCDGKKVGVFTPPDLPPDDRTDVVLAGFQKLLAEELPLDDDERLVFLDELGLMFDGAPVTPLIRAGAWVDQERERGARRVRA